jgi:phenylpropionate dioxygenase-like ring-hydroxylating dioxygenase large terminal subunit
MINETDDRFPEMGRDGLPLMTLSRPFYTSAHWFQRDIERVFRRRWLFVCHLSEVPNTGDYTTLEFGDDSIIVARDRQGAVNAFHNVCRHRGTRLCQPGRGHANAFVCPFHAWVYNLDGTLRGAPHMRDLDKSRYGAQHVRCEVWNGMVFINLMEDTPKPVAEYLRNTDFSGHQLEHAKVIATREYLTKANWKINGETYQECYHCAVVHGDTLGKILSATTNHTSYHDEAPEAAGDREFLIYSPDLRDGAFAPGVKTETRDGQLITKRLLGDGAEPQPPKLVSWFPSFSLGAFPDFAFIIDWLPISATETLFRTRWLVHEDAVEGVDYEVEKVVEMADQFNKEDKVIVERQQAGVNSSAYVAGPYHRPLEDDTRKYIAHYLALVKDPDKHSGTRTT